MTDIGQAAAFVFARDGEQFVLRPVAELALPETRRPLRQHRRMTGQIRVTLHDAGVAITGHHHVINQPRGVGHPARLRAAQLDAAHAGIVPEQTVAAAGNEKRNGNLRIAMRQLEHAAFLIQQSVPPLAEAVNALAVKRREAGLGMKQIAANRFERARRRIIRPRKNFLDERLVAAGLEKADAPGFCVNRRGELAVHDPREIFFDGNSGGGLFRRKQTPIAQRHFGQRTVARTRRQSLPHGSTQRICSLHRQTRRPPSRLKSCESDFIGNIPRRA